MTIWPSNDAPNIYEKIKFEHTYVGYMLIYIQVRVTKKIHLQYRTQKAEKNKNERIGNTKSRKHKNLHYDGVSFISYTIFLTEHSM